MFGAIETLLFPSDGQKNERGWKLVFAQYTRTFETYSRSAEVVIRARRGIFRIESIGVARILVSGDELNPLRVLLICPAQNCVNIGQRRRRGHARSDRLRERVGLHLQASTTTLRISLELFLNPLRRGGHAEPLRDHLLIVRGKRVSILKRHQLLVDNANVLRRNLFQRGNNLRIELRRLRIYFNDSYWLGSWRAWWGFLSNAG